MSGNEDARTNRADARNPRLASFRSLEIRDTASKPEGGRRPKFVPRAAPRRHMARTAPSSEKESQARTLPDHRKSERRPNRVDLLQGSNARSGRGRFGAGRGRGRTNIPAGKVAFVGSMTGGSSYSSSMPFSRSQKPEIAADGSGISVLDDRMAADPAYEDFEEMQAPKQWPPVIESEMQPMQLPFEEGPEPDSLGSVFCDPEGNVQLADDTLLFVQFPTTLPLQKAMRITKSASNEQQKDDDTKMESPEDKSDESHSATTENVDYDQSLHKAPGGYIGKLCIRKSGNAFLMIGDKRFDVSLAQTPTFCEDVYSIDTEDNELVTLGSISRHLSVTPDFDSLLC